MRRSKEDSSGSLGSHPLVAVQLESLTGEGLARNSVTPLSKLGGAGDICDDEYNILEGLNLNGRLLVLHIQFHNDLCHPRGSEPYNTCSALNDPRDLKLSDLLPVQTL